MRRHQKCMPQSFVPSHGSAHEFKKKGRGQAGSHEQATTMLPVVQVRHIRSVGPRREEAQTGKAGCDRTDRSPAKEVGKGEWDQGDGSLPDVHCFTHGLCV